MKIFLSRMLASLLLFSSAVAQAVEPIGAFAPGARVLFQGDSITDGNRGRSLDPNHILGHGYAFIVAAKHGAAYPEAKLEFYNRGVSGNTVLELEKRWQKDTLDLKPDVLSILIGVNDRGRVPLEQYEQVYDKLLTDAKAANPKLKLVLCEPFVVNHLATTAQQGSPSADVVKRQEIVARLAKKHGAALARFQVALDRATERGPAAHWIWDDIHPTYSGHQILADEWERAVREYWK
ncbi:MAG: SGNH/GDSL hydrolase family protein [Planctomycetia bacterium]|nr:SGNH/GDSL hydrolase family protein [Planctomycetia bacterium]